MLFTGLSGQGFQNFLKQIFLKETLNSFSVHFDNASCKLWRSPGCFLVDHKLFPFFLLLGPRGSLFCLCITTWCLWELFLYVQLALISTDGKPTLVWFPSVRIA
jgi:hypothetical protein